MIETPGIEARRAAPTLAGEERVPFPADYAEELVRSIYGPRAGVGSSPSHFNFHGLSDRRWWQEEPGTDQDRLAAAVYLTACLGEYGVPLGNPWGVIENERTLPYAAGFHRRAEANRLLWRIGERRGWTLPRWPRGAPFAVALSHDVDYLVRWGPNEYRRLKQNLDGASRARGLATKVWFRINAFISRASRDPYLCLEEWVRRERELGVTATYFLMACTDPTRYNSCYDLSDARVRAQIDAVTSSGNEIGLHASYNTMESPALLVEEKSRLEAFLGTRVDGVRQHYLRFRIPATWRVQEEAGFRYDSSLGYPTANGFRCGLAYPYRPYDFGGRRAFCLWEMPLTLMDGPLISELEETRLPLGEYVEALVGSVRETGGVLVLNWHPHYLREQRGYAEIYFWLVEMFLEAGAWVTHLGNILDWWESEKHHGVRP